MIKASETFKEIWDIFNEQVDEILRTGWGEIIFTIQQKQLLKIENYFPQCRDTPDFICYFIQQVLGLSKEVHNGFLAQRT